MTKDEIRKTILKMRRELSAESVASASEAVCSSAVKLDEIINAKNIMLYSDFKNEIKTAELTAMLLFKGKRVFLPVVDGDEMYAADIRSGGFKKNAFGIDEPAGEGVDPSVIDVCVIPGVAFDTSFNRIGFGRGYYDRFLKKAPDCVKIGFAYDFQIVDALPAEEHDAPLDIIVTPKEILRRERN